MALFTYRATNEDGKEMKGTIEAANADAAVLALEELHLEVIEVNEAMRIQRKLTPNEVSVPSTQYVFEGTDEHGKIRKGSIAAKSKREAYDRLRKEQLLVPTSLVLQGSTPQIPDPDLSTWNSSLQITQKPPSKSPVREVSKVLPSPPPPPPAPPPPPPPAPRSVPSAPVQLIRPSVQQVPKKSVQAIERTLPAGTLETKKEITPSVSKKPSSHYHPVFSTIRLYCGWLLAWYGLFVAIGYYAHVRKLPWDIPFVESFFVSPLIFTFVIAVFGLLLFSSLHRSLRGGIFLGIFFTVLWAVCTSAIRFLI